MPSEVTSSTAAAWLKRMYQPKYVQNSICKKSSRIYAMASEKSDCGGDSYNFLSVVNELSAGSAVFSTAQTQSQNNTTPFGQQYNVPYFQSHEPFNVAGDIVLKTKTKEGGWLPALDFSVKSALSYAAHRHSVRFFASGWGEVGQLTAGQTLSSAVVTLNDPSTVVNFLPGQWVTFASALGGVSTRGTNTALQVLNVNYNTAPGSTGHLTLSAALNTISGGGGSVAASDFIFLQDDRLAAGTSQVCGVGLAGWLPIPGAWFDPAGSNPTLYGVNRSINSRLTGNFIDGTKDSVKATLIRAAQTVSSIGNAEKPIAVISPNKYTELSQSLDTNQRYVELTGRGSMGFKTMAVFADGIEMAVLSDKYCSDKVGYVLDAKDAQINSCGPAPHIDETDGLSLLRQQSDFGYEGRILSLYNYTLNNTAAAAQIQWS